MPRKLAFQLGDRSREFTMHKVERAKLYGSKQLQVLDEDDEPCNLVTLAEDGRTLIGHGGTGLGYLSVDGDWCERNELQPVDVEGEVIKPVASSFAEPIQLFDVASYDEYLDHDIRLVYELRTDDDVEDLIHELQRGTIFRFPFSYRGGLQADAGFMILSQDEAIFMVIGTPTVIEMLGLPHAATVSEDEGTSEDELMDFDMI